MNQQQKIIAIAGSSAFVLLVGVFLYLRKHNASSNEEDDDENSMYFADLNARAGETASASQTVLEIKVPSYIVGAIIGKGGSNIKQLKAKYGVRFDFDREDLKKDPTNVKTGKEDRTLVIRGEREKVQAAELGVKEIIANTPKYVEEEILIPVQACGRIIGKGGKNVRDMCNVSGAKILIDRNDVKLLGDKKRVHLSGTTVQVDYAKLLIEEKIEEEKVNRDKYSKNENLSASNLNFLNNLPTAQVPEDGSYFKVFVSAIDQPDHIWVQVVSRESLGLDEMTKELTEYYGKLAESDQQLDQGMVGDTCAAPFDAIIDNEAEWYRACILKINTNATARLRYIDFGDIRDVHLNKLKALKKEYQHKPAYAVESFLPIQPAGVSWSEECMEELQKLTYCAQWLPVMAKVIGHKEINGYKHPVLDLVDTSNEKDVNIVNVMVSKGHASKPSTEASVKQATELNKEGESIKNTPQTLLSTAEEDVIASSSNFPKEEIVSNDESCTRENNSDGMTSIQDDTPISVVTTVSDVHAKKETSPVIEGSVVKVIEETQADFPSEQVSVVNKKPGGNLIKESDSQRHVSTESDDFVDIDIKTVDGAITAIVSEHIPTEVLSQVDGESDPDRTVVDEGNDELQKSLGETSRKNVLSSLEMSKENLLTMSNDDVSMNDSFATARSDLTLTDTDETTSFLSAQERLTPVNDISVSLPDLLVTNSKDDVTPIPSPAGTKQRSSSQFQIQFIDEKTHQVLSSESLTASFEKSPDDKKIGKETTV